MEDQPADSGDLTTERSEKPEEPETTAVEPQSTAEEPEAPVIVSTWGEAGKPRRGWRLFGRRRRAEPASGEPEVPDAASASEPSPEARPKPRPVGKGRRIAVAEATDEPADAEKVEETSESADTPEEAVDSSADVAAEESEDAPVEADAADEDAKDEDAKDEDAGEDEAPTEDAKPPVLVPFRPAGKRLTYAAAGAAVLFVGAGAFAGAMAQPYLADRALVDTKLQVAQTSADAITTLWTYTPDNIETLPNRAERYLSNDFANQYRTFIDSIAPTNKQAQISNQTQVMGTAVETITPTEATAIVYTNSVSTSPVTKNVPSLRYLSYRVSLVRDGSEWRITKMPALTQLDLSPQL